jgi:DNA-binding MarR family transcriptional regulator
MMETINNAEVLTIFAGIMSEKIKRPFHRALAQEGITISFEQCLILSCLSDNNKATQQTLCQLTHKDKPSITRLVDKLETKDLVKRITDKKDRRKNHICLTSSGYALCIKTQNVVQRLFHQAVANIDELQLNECRNVLQNIMQNLATVG